MSDFDWLGYFRVRLVVAFGRLDLEIFLLRTCLVIFCSSSVLICNSRPSCESGSSCSGFIKEGHVVGSLMVDDSGAMSTGGAQQRSLCTSSTMPKRRQFAVTNTAPSLSRGNHQMPG